MPGLDVAAAALLWLWFVNLFNFMDGIDGLAGSEAAAIGTGLVVFAGVGSGLDPGLAALSGTAAAAALGFLVWNWAPARIFLGDVGSVPCGYLLGFLLLDVAARGHWKIALILPLYFLADATLTLLRRLARGELVLAGASPAFLSTRRAARSRPRRGRAPGDRRRSDPRRLRLGSGEWLGDPRPRGGGGGGGGAAREPRRRMAPAPGVTLAA